MDYEKIDAFWTWFEANEALIRNIYEDDNHRERDRVVSTLNNQVLQFGMFTWEIGRGSYKPYFFTISPNGDKELLEISRAVIEAAPHLPQWEFSPAKPAKNWDMRFTIFDEDFNEWDVDATAWRFVLQQSSPQEVIISIAAPNIANLDHETRREAAELVISSQLGEELRIRYVAEITVLPEFNKYNKATSSPIAALKKEVENLLTLPDDEDDY